jgi:Copine
MTPETEYDFVDYLKGGLNIALFIGIDFTASNGLPHNPASLHYINSNKTMMNPYQLVIKECGDILLDYDDDKLVPVYGFGADLGYPQMKTNGVSHSFPCTGIKGTEEVYHIQGIFDVYEYAHKHISFNGPTFFAPLFKDIIDLTRVRSFENPDNYNFFMIITDGEIHDMVDTVECLVNACELPLSVVIIGVGDETFENMKRLDSGDCCDKLGRVPSRDICRFVRFK